MVTNKPIKLANLLVNTENYRFESVASQKEAIDKMIQNQAEKLFNLAEHIVTHGLNPNDPVQVAVSSHDKKLYNVLEGNRRIVALKLFNNPDLIDDPSYDTFKKKFKKLKEKKGVLTIKEISCTVYDSPNEADTWIKLKHAGQVDGVGTVSWNAQQIQRFEEKVEGKSSVPLQIINYLKTSNTVSSPIKEKLNELSITNLNRLLSDPDIREFLGITVENGFVKGKLEQKEVSKGLIQVVKDLLDPEFKVRDIYAKVDRKDYIKKFPKDKIPNQKAESNETWTLNGAENEPGGNKEIKKKKKKLNDRKVLIPRACVMSIENERVNDIYSELQKLDVEKYVNAVAVLFRVFIELSVDSYIDSNKLSKAVTSAKDGSSLEYKVLTVASHLENLKKADENICKGIRSAVKNKHDLLGINTWNAYVHFNLYSPTAKNLIITWNNVQAFVEILWANIN